MGGGRSGRIPGRPSCNRRPAAPGRRTSPESDRRARPFAPKCHDDAALRRVGTGGGQRGARRRLLREHFNWHNVFGLWSAVPLFIVVLTAVPISYAWANDLLYRLTGTEPPALQGPGGPAGPGGGSASREGAPDLAGLNRLWEKAELEVAGWRSISLRLPQSARAPVSFTIDTGDGGQPQRRLTLTLSRADESAVRRETFAGNNLGRRLRLWSRFAHTGEAFGIAGQTVAGIASAAGVMLVWTGVLLALRRFAAWRVRRA